MLYLVNYHRFYSCGGEEGSFIVKADDEVDAVYRAHRQVRKGDLSDYYVDKVLDDQEEEIYQVYWHEW